MTYLETSTTGSVSRGSMDVAKSVAVDRSGSPSGSPTLRGQLTFRNAAGAVKLVGVQVSTIFITGFPAGVSAVVDESMAHNIFVTGRTPNATMLFLRKVAWQRSVL